MNKKTHLSKLVSGVALISGTAIGAGTLALPTNTALPGFFPTIAVFVCAWVFMTLGALLILEVNQWFPGETNLISMSQATLGKVGKVFAWISYLLLLYGLISAYLAALASFLPQLSVSALGPQWSLTQTSALVLVTALTGLLLFCGMNAIDRLNRLLMLGLVVSYFMLVGMTAPQVKPVLLTQQMDIAACFPIFPLVITTLGFAIIVPSLNSYFERDIPLLKKIILMGSLFPLIVYIVWEFCILGAIPLEGPFGLLALKNNPQVNLTDILHQLIGNPMVRHIAQLFFICTIVTSLVGVSVSLLHFLADGLKLDHKRIGQRLLLIGGTFVPPLTIMLINPHSFDRILSFSGIFVALILGILPALMVWRGRYHQRLQGNFTVLGGKALLVAMFVFFSYVIVQEIINCSRLSF